MSTAKLIVSFLATGALLVYAFYGIDLQAFWQSVTAVDGGVIAVLLVLPLVQMVFRARRWQILLGSLRPLPYARALSYTMIGFMANNLLPARAGEVVKALLLARRQDIPVVAVFATVVVERVFDALVLTLMLGILMAIVPLPEALQLTGIIVGVVGVMFIAAVVAISHEDSRLRSALMRVCRRLPGRLARAAIPRFEAFLGGLSALRHPRGLLEMALVSVLVWGSLVVAVYVVLVTYPYGAAPAADLWLASGTVIVVVAFAVVVPAAPGFFGVTQAAFWVALQLFGFQQADAIGASVIFNLTQYAAVTVAGILFLFHEGLGVRHLVAANQTSLPPIR